MQINRTESSIPASVHHRPDLNAGMDIKKCFLRGRFQFYKALLPHLAHGYVIATLSAILLLLHFHLQGLIPGRVLTAIIGPCKLIISLKTCTSVIELHFLPFTSTWAENDSSS